MRAGPTTGIQIIPTLTVISTPDSASTTSVSTRPGRRVVESHSDVMKERGLRSSCPSRARMLGVFTLFHDEGGPCERILRGSTVCRYGSASAPFGAGADDRDWRASGDGADRQHL